MHIYETKTPKISTKSKTQQKGTRWKKNKTKKCSVFTTHSISTSILIIYDRRKLAGRLCKYIQRSERLMKFPLSLYYG